MASHHTVLSKASGFEKEGGKGKERYQGIEELLLFTPWSGRSQINALSFQLRFSGYKAELIWIKLSKT